MVRLRYLCPALCIAAMLAGSVLRAEDKSGQDMLSKATELKLTAENAGDLNDVITLCRDALAAGLDQESTKFANELLAGTLTQRADMVCTELFESPVRPGRARRFVQMAMSDLQETLKIEADQPLAQYLIGRLYAHLGEKDKAITALNEAVRLSGEDLTSKAQALMIRAGQHDDPAKRQADFDEAVKLTPSDPDVLRFRGMHHLTENHGEQAVADFTAALALEPDDADTHEALGIAQSLLEKYDEATQSFNKAIELAPENAAAHTHRARVRAIKGDTEAALVDVEHALELQPGSVQALQLHASLLASTGEFDRALRDLSLLRTAMPNNPDLLLQIAALHHAAKQTDEAVATYDAVLEADPKNAAAYRGRADTRLSLGKQAEALADYEKALEHDPKNNGVLNNLAWLLATSPEDKLRNGKRAIELAKQACEVTEYKQAHILSTLAASYAEAGDFDSAVNWSTKAVEIGPDELKGQLEKELNSYKTSKPWREAAPPESFTDPQQDKKPDEGSAPADGETVGNKRAR